MIYSSLRREKSNHQERHQRLDFRLIGVDSIHFFLDVEEAVVHAELRWRTAVLQGQRQV
jgi:hypothetical protein